jgi:hypothetical protein
MILEFDTLFIFRGQIFWWPAANRRPNCDKCSLHAAMTITQWAVIPQNATQRSHFCWYNDVTVDIAAVITNDTIVSPARDVPTILIWGLMFAKHVR